VWDKKKKNKYRGNSVVAIGHQAITYQIFVEVGHQMKHGFWIDF